MNEENDRHVSDQEMIGAISNCNSDELVSRFEHDSIFRAGVIGLESRLNSNDGNFSSHLANNLNADEAKSIIIFFTKMDRHYEIMKRLSVSPIPMLLKILKDKNENEYTYCMDWIFKNKDETNYWIPTGSMRHGKIRSYDEYMVFCSDEKIRLDEHNRRNHPDFVAEYRRDKKESKAEARRLKQEAKKQFFRLLASRADRSYE